MNLIRQRMSSLKNRARQLETSLCQWALYDDSVPREIKDETLRRLTPGEQSGYEAEAEATKSRLRPASSQIRTLQRWYTYVLEQIEGQIERARTLLEHGQHGEALGVLADVEARMLAPTEETLGYVFRTWRQHTSHELHHKLAAIDAIIRDIYLPSIKLAQQRGVVSKESLSRTPLAYVTDGPEIGNSWRQHAGFALNLGRRLPISLIGIPRSFLAQPWNLVAIAHEVSLCLYGDLDLGWEIASKLQSQSADCGVSAAHAAVWSRWHVTLFADVFATLKLGPAYVSGMIELLCHEAFAGADAADASVTPPAILRWHVMLHTLQLLNLVEPARELLSQIQTTFGDPHQQAARMGAGWIGLVNESRAVAGLIALTPCQKLGGGRVVDLAAPLGLAEQQMAVRVKDVLLAGDESAAADVNFTWAETFRSSPVTTTIALAGLRLAFDTATDYESSRRLWVRFWCLKQFLMSQTDPVRDREDREFAPGDAVLKQIAQHAIPTVRRSPVPVMAGMTPIPHPSPFGVPNVAAHVPAAIR